MTRAPFLVLAAAVVLAQLIGCASGPVGRFVGHRGPVIAATFSADGKFLGSIGEDRTVRVWDVASRRELARAAIEPPPRLYTINQIAFAPSGRTLAFACGANAVCAWDWPSGEVPRRLFTLDGIPSVVMIATDGARLVAASGGFAPAMTTEHPKRPAMQPLHVRAFDLGTARLVADVHDERCAALSVAVAPDGRRFAVVCLWADGQPARDLPTTTTAVQANLSIRALPGGDELAAAAGEGNPLMSFTRDGRYLLVGSRVLDASTGTLIRQVKGHPRMLVDDGSHVLVLQQGVGMPWDLGLATTPWVRASRVNLRTGRVSEGGRVGMSGHGGMPLLPALSPDGRFIVDYELNVWRLLD